ncbi:hypothetical protein NCCP2222_36770 [Sporosarcina sp. NCCP-2222]|uniref:hypothetical protein n=1 Tax=Sporosarcina sp. NCCP-2222 TaxID=2935073 RepID=UPI0020879533|nr:hypothetical protein [Sporosarcina sp. NCCP-2222]GKV57730.1 hypothetical protein NCCP2222_36770 [Sporosarcina sp. NCCP-2222]
METIQYAIEDSIKFLESYPKLPIEGIENSRRKWDGFWWHLAALYEMGEVRQVPESAILKAKYILEAQTWPIFVKSAEDLPTTEMDKMKMDCCHCELAVFYMILMEYGCDLDKELPWIREWFLKHQLPDGGLNCEPDAYTCSNKSSIISTLPPLEAILWYTNRDFTEEEAFFLDQGARYLIEHCLVYSKQTGEIIDKEWLKPCFPRFFEYDILRGMAFLVEWSRRRKKPLPTDLLYKGIHLLDSHVDATGIRIGRQVFDPQGPWGGHTFALLETVSEIGQVSPFLTKQFNSVLIQLNQTIS